MERLELTRSPRRQRTPGRWLAGPVPDAVPQCAAKSDRAGACDLRRAPVNKKDKVAPGKVYAIDLPDPQPIEARPQNIPLDIVYEDDDLLVVNKPKGMVVHPAPATRTARSSTRCFTTARGSCRVSAGPSARASSTALTRTRAAFSSLPKTMPPIRRSAPDERTQHPPRLPCRGVR